MIRLFHTIFVMLVFVSTMNSGVLKGIVIDKPTNEPLFGAHLIVVGTTLSARTDFQGNFIIYGLKSGNYILRATLSGYCQTEQNITISDSDQEADTCTIFLDAAHEVSDTPESMQYQNKLKKYDEPISIFLNNPYWDTSGLASLKSEAELSDYLWGGDEGKRKKELILSNSTGFLRMGCSITNHTELPIYFLFFPSDSVRFQFDLNPSIDNKKVIERPIYGMECIPFFGAPDSSTFIEIPPHQTRSIISLRNLGYFHGYITPGTYSIRFKYSYGFSPKVGCGTEEWQENICRMAIRGEFYSENTVTFEVE